jgi:hypothetical protein
MNNPNSELDQQNPMHRLAHQTVEELNQFHDENREIAIESMEEEARVEDEVDYQNHHEKIQNEIDVASHEHSQEVKIGRVSQEPKPEDRFIEEDTDVMREKMNDAWASEQERSDPSAW